MLKYLNASSPIHIKVMNDFVLRAILLVVFACLALLRAELGSVFVLFALLLNLSYLWRFRSSMAITVFNVFLSTYWIYLIPYYFFDIPLSIYLNFQDLSITNRTMILQVVFVFVFFETLSSPKTIPKFRSLSPSRKNNLFALVMLIALLGIIIKAFPTQGILNAKYSIDMKGSILYEYALIPIILCFFLASSSTIKRLLFFVTIMLAAIPLMYGKRLATIQILLCVGVLFFDGKIKPWMTIMASFFAFVGMRFFAILRVHGEDTTIWHSLLSLNKDGIMSNNQGGVTLSSNVYLGLIEEGVFDFWYRVKSLMGTIQNIFMSSSDSMEEAFVNVVALKYGSLPGNGGFIGVFAYLWAGWMGPVVVGFVLAKVLQLSSRYNFLVVYSVLILSTFPRWNSYNPRILFKMGFWLIFMFVCVEIGSRILLQIGKARKRLAQKSHLYLGK